MIKKTYVLDYSLVTHVVLFGNYPIKVYNVYKFELYVEIFTDVTK